MSLKWWIEEAVVSKAEMSPRMVGSTSLVSWATARKLVRLSSANELWRWSPAVVEVEAEADSADFRLLEGSFLKCLSNVDCILFTCKMGLMLG
jgi:hypothetical protein